MGLTDWDDTPDGRKWWAEWWAEDFSWEGLAGKPWRGWFAPPEGEPLEVKERGDAPDGWRKATLQDYWRSFGVMEDDLIPVRPPNPWREQDTSDWGEDHWPRFTKFHCPYRDGSEAPTKKAGWDEEYDFIELLSQTLSRARRTDGPYPGNGEPDNRAQWTGIVAPSIPPPSLKPEHEPGTIHLTAARAHLAIDFNWLNPSDDRTKFGPNADFQKCAFSGATKFESSEFLGESYFHNTRFTAHAKFENAVFHGPASFRRARLFDGGTFKKAEFKEALNFSGAYSHGALAFSETIFFQGLT